ncbi:MAG: hypothetical protein MUC65_10335, partial [Pontiellaceae bacterium]|nr:hypothetical protein [Pontiellaceae bacterium]
FSLFDFASKDRRKSGWSGADKPSSPKREVKRLTLILAVGAAIVGVYVLARLLDMATPGGNFSQFTVWVDDLKPDGTTSVEWCFFRNFDFPTGHCERILCDVPMSTIGLSLLGFSALCALVRFKLRTTWVGATEP